MRRQGRLTRAGWTVNGDNGALTSGSRRFGGRSSRGSGYLGDLGRRLHDSYYAPPLSGLGLRPGGRFPHGLLPPLNLSKVLAPGASGLPAPPALPRKGFFGPEDLEGNAFFPAEPPPSRLPAKLPAPRPPAEPPSRLLLNGVVGRPDLPVGGRELEAEPAAPEKPRRGGRLSPSSRGPRPARGPRGASNLRNVGLAESPGAPASSRNVRGLLNPGRGGREELSAPPKSRRGGRLSVPFESRRKRRRCSSRGAPPSGERSRRSDRAPGPGTVGERATGGTLTFAFPEAGLRKRPPISERGLARSGEVTARRSRPGCILGTTLASGLFAPRSSRSRKISSAKSWSIATAEAALGPKRPLRETAILSRRRRSACTWTGWSIRSAIGASPLSAPGSLLFILFPGLVECRALATIHGRPPRQLRSRSAREPFPSLTRRGLAFKAAIFTSGGAGAAKRFGALDVPGTHLARLCHKFANACSIPG